MVHAQECIFCAPLCRPCELQSARLFLPHDWSPAAPSRAAHPAVCAAVHTCRISLAWTAQQWLNSKICCTNTNLSCDNSLEQRQPGMPQRCKCPLSQVDQPVASSCSSSHPMPARVPLGKMLAPVDGCLPDDLLYEQREWTGGDRTASLPQR